MPQCCVAKCGNYYSKTRGKSDVIYHMLPLNKKMSAKWMKLCGYSVNELPPKHARICSNHFSSLCYKRDLQHELMNLPLRKRLKSDAVPDRNLPEIRKSQLTNKTEEDIKTEVCDGGDLSALLSFKSDSKINNVAKSKTATILQDENISHAKTENKDVFSILNKCLIPLTTRDILSLNVNNQLEDNIEKINEIILKIKNTDVSSMRNVLPKMVATLPCPQYYLSYFQNLLGEIENRHTDQNRQQQAESIIPPALKLPKSTVLMIVQSRNQTQENIVFVKHKNNYNKAINDKCANAEEKDISALLKLEQPIKVNKENIKKTFPNSIMLTTVQPQAKTHQNVVMKPSKKMVDECISSLELNENNIRNKVTMPYMYDNEQRKQKVEKSPKSDNMNEKNTRVSKHITHSSSGLTIIQQQVVSGEKVSVINPENTETIKLGEECECPQELDENRYRKRRTSRRTMLSSMHDSKKTKPKTEESAKSDSLMVRLPELEALNAKSPNSDSLNAKNTKVNKQKPRIPERLPMRSSFRIATKRSIESLSSSITNKNRIKKNRASNDESGSSVTDQITFMAKLNLKLERNTEEEEDETPMDAGTVIENENRLKKGALPDRNLPTDFLKEEHPPESAIAILLAVGLVPAPQPAEKTSGGLPQDLNKMRIMEDVKEGCNVQPSSPGHAEQRTDDQKALKENHTENGLNAETVSENGQHENGKENVEENAEHVPKIEEMSPENDIDTEEKCEKNSDSNHVNEEALSDASSSENQSHKRKLDVEEGAIKKLRLDLQENFLSRDKILSEFMEISECSNVDQIQTISEQILGEIKMLNDVAKEKEREWNNILHLKKLKEELLLRLQRRRHVILLNDKTIGDINWDSQNDSGGVKNNSNQSILKTNLSNPQKPSSSKTAAERNQNKFRNILPRPQTTLDLNGSLDYRSRQRPVLDVQSIIADYRQRHPEAVPRRGRRIRNNNTGDINSKSSNGVINFSSLALGSGAQVRQNLDLNNELGLLLNALEGNRQDAARLMTTDAGPLMGDSNSFKDILVHFARLSQSEKNEFLQNAIKPPPPYPEVTVHPVPSTSTSTASSPSNSLLHGILTKSPTKSNSKSSFSPTLARLLTAPERGSGGHTTSTPITSTVVHPANVSISEILATSKGRSEITITPVGNQYDATSKSRSGQMEEEEAEDSADRLVIDEGSEAAEARRGDNSSEVGDEVPQCQGCNHKQAQFVCAGCGNQWYCSRDCQVAAWDEHSEVCSG